VATQQQSWKRIAESYSETADEFLIQDDPIKEFPARGTVRVDTKTLRIDQKAL